MRSDAIYKILEETKVMFLKEAKNKLSSCLMVFLKFIISPCEEKRFSLENFFHSIKGAAAVSGFEEIRLEAYAHEMFFMKVDIQKTLEDKEILDLVKGFALLQQMIENEEKKRIAMTKTEHKLKKLNAESFVGMKNNVDQITNIYNRSYFYEKFNSHIAEVEASGGIFTVALLDIVDFRLVNRNKGYFIGDHVLKKFAEELSIQLKDELIFRMEGDKFAIIIKDKTSNQVLHILSQIKASLNTRVFDPLENGISFKAVVNTIKDSQTKLDEIISTLYENLFKLKEAGKEEIVIIENDDAKTPKILIVEDVSVMIFHIKKRLEVLGYQIFYAVDGQEAIQKAMEIKPDLMLVDIMLPKIDGYEVCRRVKADATTKHVRIIVLTSRSDDHDVLMAYQAGADDFIPKPFSLVDLEKRVKRLL